MKAMIVMIVGILLTTCPDLGNSEIGNKENSIYTFKFNGIMSITSGLNSNWLHKTRPTYKGSLDF